MNYWVNNGRKAPEKEFELKVQPPLPQVEEPRTSKESFDVPVRMEASLCRLLLIGRVVVSPLRLKKLALKLRDVRTEIIRENDGSYAVACSALGVYSVGKSLREAKRNFEQALDLHLSVVREKAKKDLTIAAVSA